MRKGAFRFLILTDHEKHSVENSLYALVRTLVAQPDCAEVCLVSRSLPENKGFFADPAQQNPFGSLVDRSFSYSGASDLLAKKKELSQWQDVYDVLWLRLPRPVSDDFLRTLRQVFSPKLIINDPEGIITTSSKAFLLQFPALCPPMRLCRSEADVTAFAKQFPIVLKPLREYGGKGIVRVINSRVEGDGIDQTIAEYCRTLGPQLTEEGMLGMKFLHRVSEGDKRLLVVDGEILAASLRRPPQDSWICNVAQGGTSELAEVDPSERRIVAQLAPTLRAHGILLCGIDTLVNDDGERVLSEINTLSIGGFPQAEQQTGRPILQQTIDRILKHTHDFYQ